MKISRVAGVVAVVDIDLEIKLVPRFAYCRFERREILLSRAQQRQAVALEEVNAHSI